MSFCYSFLVFDLKLSKALFCLLFWPCPLLKLVGFVSVAPLCNQLCSGSFSGWQCSLELGLG